MPKNISQDFGHLEANFACPENKPSIKQRVPNNLTYPINLGRNIAHDSATIHFVLASDIELYPSSGVVSSYFEMIKSAKEEVAFRNK